MTASIVGWAHTPFGKFDTETVESLVVKVANEAITDAGIIRPAMSTRSCSGISTPASQPRFHGLAGAAGRSGAALQAGHPGRERLRHRIGGGASGHSRHRRGCCQIRAGGRRRADDAHPQARRSARTC